MTITITELYIYPVKSLRGIPLKEATLSATGLEWDRHWMIVNSEGRFITQRQLPEMVLVHTTLTDTQLILSRQGIDDFILDLHSETKKEPFTARVWKDACEVIDEGEAVSQWLTEAIGSPKPLRLVQLASGHTRPQSKPNLLGPDTTTKFADAAPYLICNETSLDAVNQTMQQQQLEAVTMERFRPNIVIKGIDAFSEHNLAGLEHPHYALQHCYPCQRCVIPTIDLNTGERHPQQQPFSLIADINSMPYNAKAPAFGENAILSKGNHQTIRVGDTLSSLME